MDVSIWGSLSPPGIRTGARPVPTIYGVGKAMQGVGYRQGQDGSKQAPSDSEDRRKGENGSKQAPQPIRGQTWRWSRTAQAPPPFIHTPPVPTEDTRRFVILSASEGSHVLMYEILRCTQDDR